MNTDLQLPVSIYGTTPPTSFLYDVDNFSYHQELLAYLLIKHIETQANSGVYIYHPSESLNETLERATINPSSEDPLLKEQTDKIEEALIDTDTGDSWLSIVSVTLIKGLINTALDKGFGDIIGSLIESAFLEEGTGTSLVKKSIDTALDIFVDSETGTSIVGGIFDAIVNATIDTVTDLPWLSILIDQLLAAFLDPETGEPYIDQNPVQNIHIAFSDKDAAISYRGVSE